MRTLLHLLLLLLLAPPAQAQELVMRLTLVQFTGSQWKENEIREAAERAARILAQCWITWGGTELVRADVEARFRVFHTPTSRELARSLRAATPAVYFVDATRQDPAFDAEAIGRGNSRTRPELQDTVWVVLGARDLDLVLAHELAHVLMDSGEHSEEPGNLMRERTAPGSTRLTPSQCARMRETGTANGLLQLPR